MFVKDLEPRGVIDLKLCSDVQLDSSQKKDFCFFLVSQSGSKSKTYYIKAMSAKEAKEWVEVLTWTVVCVR